MRPHGRLRQHPCARGPTTHHVRADRQCLADRQRLADRCSTARRRAAGRRDPQDEEAAILNPQLRASARATRNAQLGAAKSLAAYTVALGSGCGASSAAFQQSLGAFRAEVATYNRLLAAAGFVRARLPADAARVAAAAGKAGVSAPVDLTGMNKQYDAYRADAAARAVAPGELQTRAGNGYARCIVKAQRPDA